MYEKKENAQNFIQKNFKMKLLSLILVSQYTTVEILEST